MKLSEEIKYLEQFTTERRKQLFHRIAAKRTNYITVVLEDIFQPHNASAVLRSCDCFGIHNVHIIENRNTYHVNPEVALGSDKWLSITKYKSKRQNSAQAIDKLKKFGYRIIATTPHRDDIDLEQFDLLQGKFALMFGTELSGLSDTALDMADEYLKIPMHGFTESFNISVSAAIILHFLTHKLRNSTKIKWNLSDAEKNEIILHWLKVTVKDSDRILAKYHSEKNTSFNSSEPG